MLIRKGIMIDCARDAVRKVETIKKLIDLSKKLELNSLYLYLEDVFEIIDEPYFGYLRGRYNSNELKEMDDYAYINGIEIIPCIQTLGHLHQIFKWKPYKNINDIDGVLLAGSERTYLLIENMIKTISQIFRSKNINTCMDEAFGLGRGQYLNKNGYHNEWDIFLKHLLKVLNSSFIS